MKPTAPWILLAALALAGCGPTAGGVAPAASLAPASDNPVAALNADALKPAEPAGRTLLAVYMVGSDLEDDVRPRDGRSDEEQSGSPNTRGQATTDLKEIAAALSGLTPDERARVDVLVAFGGARQAGWKGVKVVDGEGLVADAADGVFGNAAGGYVSDAPGADMAQGSTFQAFLAQVQARAAGSSRVMLELWDHGGSYQGIGPDTNSGGKLSLDAIRSALAVTRFQADVLGFDACLMASVEVAAAARGHFSYMVASSETEPGHGWDYKLWLPFVAKQPEASMAQVAAHVVDAYLDSPAHYGKKALTLSVLNVDRAAALADPLDALARSAAGSPTLAARVVEAAEDAPEFGLHGPDLDAVSMDLVAFAQGLGADGEALASAARASVVYSRTDQLEADTAGITTFALTNRGALDTAAFTGANASSQAWFGFVSGLYATATGDHAAPAFGPETPAALNGRAGWSFTATDDRGLAEVAAEHATSVGNQLVLAERDDEPHDASQRDLFFLPAWDGRSLTIAGQVVPVVVRAKHTDDTLYAATVTWNGLPATLFLVGSGAEGAIATTWVVPDQPEADRQLEEARNVDLQPGDTLAFTQPLVTPDLAPAGSRTSPAVTFQATTDFRWTPAAGPAVYGLAATDLNGNQARTTPKTP